jgi:hypothetical protein
MRGASEVTGLQRRTAIAVAAIGLLALSAAEARADLSVTKVKRLPASVTKYATGDSVAVRATVRNDAKRGEGRSRASVYLSADKKRGRGDKRVGRIAVSKLKPGKKDSGKTAVQWPDRAKDGKYFFVVCADSCKASRRFELLVLPDRLKGTASWLSVTEGSWSDAYASGERSGTSSYTISFDLKRVAARGPAAPNECVRSLVQIVGCYELTEASGSWAVKRRTSETDSYSGSSTVCMWDAGGALPANVLEGALALGTSTYLMNFTDGDALRYTGTCNEDSGGPDPIYETDEEGADLWCCWDGVETRAFDGFPLTGSFDAVYGSPASRAGETRSHTEWSIRSADG